MNVRLHRNKQLPKRPANFELVHDYQVDNFGELIHFVMLVDVEPLDGKTSLKNQASIRRKQTWKLNKLPSNKEEIDVK